MFSNIVAPAFQIGRRTQSATSHWGSSEFLRAQKRKDQVDQQAGGQEEEKDVFKHCRPRLSDRKKNGIRNQPLGVIRISPGAKAQRPGRPASRRSRRGEGCFQTLSPPPFRSEEERNPQPAIGGHQNFSGRKSAKTR